MNIGKKQREHEHSERPGQDDQAQLQLEGVLPRRRLRPDRPEASRPRCLPHPTSGPMKKVIKRLARRPVVTNRLKSEIDVAIRFVCTPASRAAYAPIVTPCTMKVISHRTDELPRHKT